MPYKIKADFENELYRKYTARCVRLMTENTARMVQGQYIEAEYEDLINPKSPKKYTKGEISNKIKAKLR